MARPTPDDIPEDHDKALTGFAKFVTSWSPAMHAQFNRTIAEVHRDGFPMHVATVVAGATAFSAFLHASGYDLVKAKEADV